MFDQKYQEYNETYENNSMIVNQKLEQYLSRLQEACNQKADLVDKIAEKWKELSQHQEEIEEELKHMKNSQTVKSWPISTIDAIRAVNKAYQVQEEVQIDNIKNEEEKVKKIEKYNDKYKSQKRKYKGYKYSYLGGRFRLNFWSNWFGWGKKLMNCTRYGRKLFKAAGVETNSFFVYIKPTDLSSL